MRREWGIPLSPPQKNNPPNRVGSSFVQENIIGFERSEKTAQGTFLYLICQPPFTYIDKIRIMCYY